MTICLSGLDLSSIKWKPVEPKARRRKPDRRSGLPAPSVRADGMDLTRCHADGRVYDSKSAYYKAVKDAGCEIVGNEKLPERKPFEPKGIKEDIKRAYDQVVGT